MSRTALIIETPPWPTLVRLRQTWAADARRGVPPHLTVIFPFAPTELLDESALGTLEKTISGISSFDFSLTRTGWFGEEVLWLAPEAPASFLEITAAVSIRFPDYPPYGGAHDGFTPHATVGDSATCAELREAERVIRQELPLTGTASDVTLLVEEADGHWREYRRFPLSISTG